MEKRSSFFYFILFFLVAIASFGDGTREIIDFIGIDKSISLFFREIGVPLLGAVAFILGYFVNAFGVLNPKKHWVGLKPLQLFGQRRYLYSYSWVS